MREFDASTTLAAHEFTDRNAPIQFKKLAIRVLRGCHMKRSKNYRRRLIP
jgi:hypothetical protein